MRLIDADALQDEIEEWLDTVGNVTIGKGLSYYGELQGCIKECPTIDAEPVRHGRLTDITSDEWYAEWGDCSICGESNHANAKYCQYCGAKMNEESEVQE